MPVGRDIARFLDDKGNVTAVLENTGRLALKDGAGGLEIYEDWRKFVMEMMGLPPLKAEVGSPEMLDQLSQALGRVEAIEEYVSSKENPVKKSEKANGAAAAAASATGTETAAPPKPAKEKKTKVKAAAPAPAPKPPSKADKAVTEAKKRQEFMKQRAEKRKQVVVVDPANFPECGCGCGQKCKSALGRFLAGHDAKFHSMIKKYQRGEMKFGELTKPVQSYVRSNGVKAASAAAE